MRSKKKEFTGDVDITETQYTRQEVAEMLQNADDISKQLKKQDKNANIIAGILVIGVGALAWATKIASLGGGLVLGGLSAAVFVSLWYFFQNASIPVPKFQVPVPVVLMSGYPEIQVHAPTG